MLSRVWDHSRSTGIDRLVLLAIADNANDQGLAWPGFEHLASKTRVARSTVQLAIKRLCVLGELSYENRRVEGRQAQNIFKVLIPNVGNSPIPNVGNSTDTEPAKADTDAPPRADTDVDAPTSDDAINQNGTVIKSNRSARKTRATPPDASLNGNPADYVAVFVDEYRKRGTEPPKNWLKRVGKACREMLAEETEPEILAEAVRRAARENRPGSITYKVADIELEKAGMRRAR